MQTCNTTIRKPAEIDLMLKLAFISFAGCNYITNRPVEMAVSRWVKKLAPDQKLVWGPVANSKCFDLFTTALVYIVKDEKTDSSGKPIYTLVLRGTNPFSWSSWLRQDFAVNDLIPWKLLSPHAQPTAAQNELCISEGASRTLSQLNSLKYKGETIESFLFKKLKDEGALIRVTGHSLGGMAAMMYPVWLQDQFSAAGLDVKGRFMTTASAALTPGDAAFTSYTEDLYERNENAYIRIVNNNDLATKCWEEEQLAAVAPTLYTSQSAATPADVQLIQNFYNWSLNRDYRQAKNELVIPSKLANVNNWLLQIGYQHMFPYMEYMQVEAERSQVRNMLNTQFILAHPVNGARMVLASRPKAAPATPEEAPAAE